MLSELVHQIADLQLHGNEKFPDGLFVSYRLNSCWFYQRLDSNIFASSSVAFILRCIKEDVSKEYQSVIEGVLEGIKVNYPLYQNKEGLKTFNFWQTKPTNHFPNGYLMKRFKHFKLPDDIDDTALVYLTSDYKTEEVLWLKEKLKKHTPAHLVYNTWFGVNMPAEKDVCALCNLMYLLFESKTDFNEYDFATLNYLNQVIISKEFLSETFWVSRHYGTLPLIVYHYGRLLGRFEIDELKEAKEKLRDLIPVFFEKETGWLNKVLLQTSFLKLYGNEGEQGILKWNPFEGNWKNKLKSEQFYAFIGAPFAPLSTSLWKGIASKAFFQIGWKCEAHELALVLENVILRQKYFETKS